MNIAQAALLSIVEGLTEFLPISSTGHLTIASELLKIYPTEFVKSFEIFIQLGAILAVVFLYWKTIITNLNVWKKIFVAFIPTGVFGLVLYKFVKHYLLGNNDIVLLSLFIGGLILIVLESIHVEKSYHSESIEKIPYKTAFFIGIIQSLSMIPGVSRAAATIMGALFLGTKRKTAVEFSFLLAIPTMLAATSLDLVKSNFSFTTNEITLLAIGFVGSFVVAIFSVKFLLTFVKNNTFIPFGIYRIIAAIVFYFVILRT